ncbi:hypothetical protein BGZ98_003954 [Dissophora globulifera]|nr:hypothetical protein BGZ98_003954 [Dissophora globulifera]
MSIARAIQGTGAGFTIPPALALLTTTYAAGSESNFTLSMFGGAACVGQTIFYITAITAACLCAIGFLVISKENDNPASADRRVDYFGIFLFTIGIIAVVYYLSESTTAGWASAKTLAHFFVGIAALIGFVFWEDYIEYPIMPLRSRSHVASHPVLLSLRQWLCHWTLHRQQNVRLCPDKGITLMIGWIFIAASAVIFAQVAPGQTYWHFAFPAMIVNCLGISPTWMCCQVNADADANDEDQGVVGAVFNVAMQVGGPAGLAIATIVSQAHEGLGGSPVDFMDGYRAAFYPMAIFAGVAFVIAGILASNQDPIEFTGKMPETPAEDQEKGDYAVNSSSVRTVSEAKNVEAVEDKKQTVSASGH